MIDLGTVGARIVARRRKAGLTQKQLARKMRVCPQAVSKWERGRALPDILYVDELADILGCSIDWLLTGKREGEEYLARVCAG